MSVEDKLEDGEVIIGLDSSEILVLFIGLFFLCVSLCALLLLLCMALLPQRSPAFYVREALA